jgi:hypothetical protein
MAAMVGVSRGIVKVHVTVTRTVRVPDDAMAGAN